MATRPGCESKDENREPYEYPALLTRVDGAVYVGCVTKELFDEIACLPVQHEDVFIATYIKAGTTWMSEILWQIFTNGQVSTKSVNVRIPFLELFNYLKETKTISAAENATVTDWYLGHPSPRIFKTHLPYRLVPKGGSAAKPKYVCVIRNPKDTAVSHYHHLRRVVAYEFDRTWDEYFEMMMAGRTDYGSWFDHVLGWWEHRDDPNILFIKYESMKKDPKGAVRRVAEFVGKYLSDEMIDKIAEQTTFDFMKDGEQFYQDNDPSLYVPGEPNQLRKGVVGDWRNYFTNEQNRRFDELYTKRMDCCGLELEF